MNVDSDVPEATEIAWSRHVQTVLVRELVFQLNRQSQSVALDVKAQPAASISNTGFAWLLCGPSDTRSSSSGLGWSGFSVERRALEPGERTEKVLNQFVLAVWRTPTHGEQNTRACIYQPVTKPAGTVSILCPGIIPPARSQCRAELILCGLMPDFVSGVEDELERKPTTMPHYEAVLRDTVLQRLITLLESESADGGFSGQLYSSHLAHALAVRLLLRETRQPTRKRPSSKLPRHLLQRALDRMHELHSDLDLSILAAETGYSRSQFLRMFHAAVGCTPHRYRLQLRLNRAQELMKERRQSLIDIAAMCGFSSHAHLSRTFRQLLGTTPSEYRRSL